MPIKIGSVLSTADVAHIAGGLGVAARVGIDGPGASGKSTLAAGLAEVLPEAVLVEGDDFYRPESDTNRSEIEVAGLFDLSRLASQVLIPHTEGRVLQYQRYDWESGSLGDWATGASGAPLIVEGVYSTHPILRDFYDVWMPAEDRYIAEQAPQNHAHLVLDRSGATTAQTGEAKFAVVGGSLF